MKKIISAIITLLAIVYILGTVGACERDIITVGEMIFRAGISVGVLFVVGEFAKMFE